MKKLINLFLGLTITTIPLFSQNLSEKFNKYLQKADTLSEKIFTLPSIGLVQMYNLDLNSDEISDMVEIYKISYSEKEGRLKKSKFPLYYLIDFNGDGNIGYEEFFIDEKMDGLNGNETFSDYLRKLNTRSKKIKI